MQNSVHFSTSISLSQLALQLRNQLSYKDRTKLVKLLQSEEDEKEPTSEKILKNLKEDYDALKKGTLKTRPAIDFLKELEKEGLL